MSASKTGTKYRILGIVLLVIGIIASIFLVTQVGEQVATIIPILIFGVGTAGSITTCVALFIVGEAMDHLQRQTEQLDAVADKVQNIQFYVSKIGQTK